jgi:hypothetical protein
MALIVLTVPPTSILLITHQPNSWSPKLKAIVQPDAAVYDLAKAGTKVGREYKITWVVQVANNVARGTTLDARVQFINAFEYLSLQVYVK